MSQHRTITKLDRFKSASKKAGVAALKGAAVAAEVAHRAALRADADRLKFEAQEANRKAWSGEHEAGFVGGVLDSWAKQDEAKRAEARYREVVGG